MKIAKISIENFKGIKKRIEILTNDFNCIVGKNDVGKSTILNALDIFLNDKNPSIDDKNVYNESGNIIIELSFTINTTTRISIDESITTTFVDEELLDEENLLVLKKKWDVIGKKTPRAEWYINRKIYTTEDFLFMKEPDLINLCKKLGIETTKGSNEEYNNVEKRRKLREFYQANSYEYSYEYTPLATTGTTRQKTILEAIKCLLPSFEYFKADTSLSESDNSIQKYFREKALNGLKGQVDTNELEETIRNKVEESLSKITTLINSIVPEEEHITANVEFDWSKLISTTFKSEKDTANIPLASRGDGFRRITMMSYFEMLAEETKSDKNIIFGFEEPETFLHPQVQKQLYEKLNKMIKVGYQIFITTHSPIIVSETEIEFIIFIQSINKEYIVSQNSNIDINLIIDELGIKSDDKLIKVLDNIKLLFLVEGPDDIQAITHLANTYKGAGVIDKNFEDLGVHLIPIGGCGQIKTWTNLNILKNLGKPIYILQDSDRTNEIVNSPNTINLLRYGYKENVDFYITNKREMENYIPLDYFQKLTPPIEIEYTDTCDVKSICASHKDAIRLGGKRMLFYHFGKLNFNQLRSTFSPDGDNENDEFLSIYNNIKNKIES